MITCTFQHKEVVQVVHFHAATANVCLGHMFVMVMMIVAMALMKNLTTVVRNSLLTLKIHLKEGCDFFCHKCGTKITSPPATETPGLWQYSQWSFSWWSSLLVMSIREWNSKVWGLIPCGGLEENLYYVFSYLFKYTLIFFLLDAKTCSANQFTCQNQQCIPLRWKCDGDSDCSDASDENGCRREPVCSQNRFRCSDGTCIRGHWKCDGENDCHDGSDEIGCCEYRNSSWMRGHERCLFYHD